MLIILAKVNALGCQQNPNGALRVIEHILANIFEKQKHRQYDGVVKKKTFVKRFSHDCIAGPIAINEIYNCTMTNVRLRHKQRKDVFKTLH